MIRALIILNFLLYALSGGAAITPDANPSSPVADAAQPHTVEAQDVENAEAAAAENLGEFKSPGDKTLTLNAPGGYEFDGDPVVTGSNVTTTDKSPTQAKFTIGVKVNDAADEIVIRGALKIKAGQGGGGKNMSKFFAVIIQRPKMVPHLVIGLLQHRADDRLYYRAFCTIVVKGSGLPWNFRAILTKADQTRGMNTNTNPWWKYGQDATLTARSASNLTSASFIYDPLDPGKQKFTLLHVDDSNDWAGIDAARFDSTIETLGNNFSESQSLTTP